MPITQEESVVTVAAHGQAEVGANFHHAPGGASGGVVLTTIQRAARPCPTLVRTAIGWTARAPGV